MLGGGVRATPANAAPAVPTDIFVSNGSTASASLSCLASMSNICLRFLSCRCFSRDIRITILEFVHFQQLNISILLTLLLTIAVIVANTLEISSQCIPNLKIWIIVINSRAICRVGLQFYIVRSNVNRVLSETRHHSVLKFMEMLDVFGMVWFAVGNLLVFYSSSDCIDQNPIIYYLCLGYILSMYLMYFFICSLRANMVLCPSEEILRVTTEIQRMRQSNSNNNEPLNEDPIYRLTLRKRSSNNNEMFVLNEEETDFWRVWLCSFDCYETVYSVTRHGNSNGKIDASPDSLEAYAQVCPEETAVSLGDTTHGVDDFVTCSICLEDFIEASTTSPINNGESETDDGNAVVAKAGSSSMTIVVEYPCIARHLFHPQCLHKWLHSSGCHGSATINCPVCRLPPSVKRESSK